MLAELPEKLEADDWVDLGAADGAAYRRAVASGNFMAMRRAAYATPSPDGSAKVARLLEIVDESAASGWKVVVFSYFRDVLTVVEQAVGPAVVGQLNGDVAPADRQRLIDEFTAIDGHAVLVSQIETGGVGLNLQAASVVILTEPQWKPSTESQAIARCHRMGQVRRVHVHRLLAEDTVDEHMLRVQAGKALLFDDYARQSAAKDANPEAIDAAEMIADRPPPGQAAAEREIIHLERERLGLASASA